MIAWKWLPGFLYRTEDEGKRGRQQRDRKRESVFEPEDCREIGIASAIKHTIGENMWRKCEIN